MRIERLPFTVYDILGYFAPGFALIFGTVTTLELKFEQSYLFSELSSSNAFNVTMALILVAVACYIVGHAVSFFGAWTIELVSIGFFGYPSKFLVHPYKPVGPYLQRDVTKNILSHFFQGFSRKKYVIAYWVLLPMSLILEILNCANATRTFTKDIKEPAISLLRSRVQEKFGVNIEPENGDNWFQLVSHSVINNHQFALARMYNYLSIYGFLRNAGAVVYILFWEQVALCVAKSDSVYFTAHILYSALFFVVFVMMFFGFTKFYRRYSQEVLFAFITCRDEAVP